MVNIYKSLSLYLVGPTCICILIFLSKYVLIVSEQKSRCYSLGISGVPPQVSVGSGLAAGALWETPLIRNKLCSHPHQLLQEGNRLSVT